MHPSPPGHGVGIGMPCGAMELEFLLPTKISPLPHMPPFFFLHPFPHDIFPLQLRAPPMASIPLVEGGNLFMGLSPLNTWRQEMA